MSSVIGWYLRWTCCPRPRSAPTATLELPPQKDRLPTDWAARLTSPPPGKELQSWSMEPRLTEPWSSAGTPEPWTSSLGLRGRRIWLPAAEPQKQWSSPTPPAGSPSNQSTPATTPADSDANNHHLLLQVCVPAYIAAAASVKHSAYTATAVSV